MPVFGEFETLGKPLFTRSRSGQARTYWIAKRRGGEDSREYFIKSIAWAGQKDATPGAPPADPSADFFESIARLNQIQMAQAERLAPIHAFGRTESELWYVTDFYPRRSLAQFSATADDITDAGLRQVVHHLANACLGLQQSTGRSHGNLKPSNVLLQGEPAPLSETPLHLIDVAGFVALRQAMETEASLMLSQGEQALREAAERRDLLCIGRILLQLIESNAIEGPADYTLPIALSTPWHALGEEAQRWLDLCNRLLAPNLSLNETNLKSLAGELSLVPPRSGRAPLITGLGVVLIAITCLAFWSVPWRHTTPARSHPQTVARPTAPTPIDNTGHVAQTLRPAVTTPPSARTAPSPLPSRSETRGPTLPASLPSRPKQIASMAKDKERTRSVPAGAATKRMDALTSQKPRGQTSVHGVNPPALSTNNSRAPSTLARADVHSGNTASRPGIAGAHSQRTPSTLPASAKSEASNSQPRHSDSGIQSASVPQKVASVAKLSIPSTSERTTSSPPDWSSSKQMTRTNAQSESSATPRLPSKDESDTSPGLVLKANEEVIVSMLKPEPVLDPAPPVSTKELDEQLRNLEIQVGRAVAIRRHSELFASLDALEGQYAKANQLTSKTKRRFELIRGNVAKKLPGASTANAMNNRFSTAPIGRQ